MYRKVFSSSSEFVLPLLKQMVLDVLSKADKFWDVGCVSTRFDVMSSML